MQIAEALAMEETAWWSMKSQKLCIRYRMTEGAQTNCVGAEHREGLPKKVEDKKSKLDTANFMVQFY